MQICSGTLAEILPPDVVIRILKPLIQMAEWPINQAAIKMLNKLVEAHPPPIISSILPEVMPGLLKVSWFLRSNFLLLYLVTKIVLVYFWIFVGLMIIFGNIFSPYLNELQGGILEHSLHHSDWLLSIWLIFLARNICCVYALNSPTVFESVETLALPLINSLN